MSRYPTKSELITSFLLEQEWCPTGKLPISSSKDGEKIIKCIDVEPLDVLFKKYDDLRDKLGKLYGRRYQMKAIEDKEGKIIKYEKRFGSEQIEKDDEKLRKMKAEMNEIDFMIAMHPIKWEKESFKKDWYHRYLDKDAFEEGI